MMIWMEERDPARDSCACKISEWKQLDVGRLGKRRGIKERERACQGKATNGINDDPSPNIVSICSPCRCMRES